MDGPFPYPYLVLQRDSRVYTAALSFLFSPVALPLSLSLLPRLLLHTAHVYHYRTVVGRRGVEGQKNRPGVTAAPGYCVAICFYYVRLGHMFVLVGCGRGARPYVSIMRR